MFAGQRTDPDGPGQTGAAKFLKSLCPASCEGRSCDVGQLLNLNSSAQIACAQETLAGFSHFLYQTVLSPVYKIYFSLPF